MGSVSGENVFFRSAIFFGFCLAFAAIASFAGCSAGKQGSQALVERFKANVPAAEFEAVVMSNGIERVARARDWKWDVRQTSSVASPMEGEITFRFQEIATKRDRGWQSDRVYNLAKKAVYRVEGGRWKLQDILSQASDDPTYWWSVSDRDRSQFDVMVKALPNDF